MIICECHDLVFNSPYNSLFTNYLTGKKEKSTPTAILLQKNFNRIKQSLAKNTTKNEVAQVLKMFFQLSRIRCLNLH